MYQWSSGTSSWSQLGSDFVGIGPNQGFGEGIALSSDGTILALGAENVSVVTVYEWDGSTWNQKGSDISGALADDKFGDFVDLSDDGSILAIGSSAYDDATNGNDCGNVFAYEWDGSSWNLKGGTRDMVGDNSNDGKGRNIAISGDGLTIAASSPNSSHADGSGGSFSGHVRIHRWNGVSWIAYGNDLKANDFTSFTYYSTSLSLSTNGEIIAVGDGSISDGYAQVFEYVAGAWSQLGSNIIGSSSGDMFGLTISLSGDGQSIAISASRSPNDDDDTNAGKVQSYKWNGTSWDQIGSTLYGAGANYYFGSYLRMSKDASIISVYASNFSTNFVGEVRVYSYEVS